MTSNADWEAMTDTQKDVRVMNLLWPKPSTFFTSGLASTWPGFGLVVDRMIELEWDMNHVHAAFGSRMIWSRRDGNQNMQGAAKHDCPKQATALAAVRAMEGKHD